MMTFSFASFRKSTLVAFLAKKWPITQIVIYLKQEANTQTAKRLQRAILVLLPHIWPHAVEKKLF